MTDGAIPTPPPLVTREALEQVILFGSQARGEARWDSDADLLVVMPFEGKPHDTVEALLAAGDADFPLDLHLRRPEEIGARYRWGDPIIREALDHGEVLYGGWVRSTRIPSCRCCSSATISATPIWRRRCNKPAEARRKSQATIEWMSSRSGSSHSSDRRPARGFGWGQRRSARRCLL